MGLKPWEFWRLTPREWAGLVKGYGRRQERLDRRVALICAAFNWTMGGKARISDYMPCRREQTPEQIEAMARALVASFGGRDETRDSGSGGQNPQGQ